MSAPGSSPRAARALSALAFAIPVGLLAGGFLVDRDAWRGAGLALAVFGAVAHLPVLFLATRLSARFRKRPWTRGTSGSWPSVTLVVAAHNEEKVIGRKAESALALAYPGRLDLLFCSDASDDGTDAILKGFAPRGLVLHRNERRTGKARMLAAALQQVRTDLVVFSDANAFYEPDAIEKLVTPFVDPEVGACTGNVRLLDGDSAAAERGREEEVWASSLERTVLALESESGSCVGVDGAMVAVRRDLVPDYEEGIILDDFVLAMHVVNSGKRVLYIPEARATEYNPPGLKDEWERRSRMLAGVVQLYRRGVGLPSAASGLLGRFLLHKVWRWCSPLHAVCAGVYVLLLLGPLPGLVALAAALLCLYGALALLLGFRPAAYKVGYLLVFQLSTFNGLWRGLAGRQSGAWRRTRR